MEFRLETHMAFLDLEKYFDRVNRNYGKFLIEEVFN